MARSDDSDDGDQQGREMDGAAELEMALGAAGMSASEETTHIRTKRTAAKSVITGKRPAEEISSSSDADNGNSAVRTRGPRKKKKKKKAKVDSGSDDGPGPEIIDVDSSEDDFDDGSADRRQFYFEEHYNSETSDDEEPTALLTLRRNKEAANAARREQKAGKVGGGSTAQPPHTPSKKNARGKAKPLVNEPYRELLNQAIDDARTRTVYPEVGKLYPSEIGGVYWTAAEKQRFFRALPCIGRHNAVALAAEVVSKSVIEVQGYLHALERALRERLAQQHVPRYSLLMMEDIPAAVEVSEECEAALENEADRTAEFIANVETKERGTEAEVIDIERARDVRARRIAGERLDDALIEPLNWIVLSERIFMASEHGRSADRPTIQNRMLENLAALVTSITRRLVHISLFQAHQRLKNTSRLRDRPPEVILRDTAAAIKMLGMPTTSEEYWRRLPRRFKLNVVNGKKGVGRGLTPEYMKYEEVEEAMKVYEDTGFYAAPAAAGGRQGLQAGSEESEEGGWETEDEDLERVVREAGAGGSDDSDSSLLDDDLDADDGPKRQDGKSEMAKYLETPVDIISYLSEPPERPLRKMQIRDVLDELHFINDDENYLNAVDKLHSMLEERRLWKLLGGWKERKEDIVERIVQAEKGIPDQPELAAWRRLEKWKRQDWREKAGKWVPIWRQKYYSRLWEMERPRRLKRSHKKIPYARRKKGLRAEEEDGESDQTSASNSEASDDDSSDSDSEASGSSDSGSSDSGTSDSSSEVSDSEDGSESE
ncbi:hypothetical protein TWF696_006920 [Orbilia brochopaga]|uniref:Uncharacterized protein n=1 Tax=Orbilia brochopaga TaxID=3140254 RepID=A0AAV9UQA4_9PEZI